MGRGLSELTRGLLDGGGSLGLHVEGLQIRRFFAQGVKKPGNYPGFELKMEAFLSKTAQESG
jgi:hypothetical protein